MRRNIGIALLGVVLALPAMAATTGWKQLSVNGTYAWRYIPATLDQSQPAPLVFFFHGSGGYPEAYGDMVEAAADLAKCVAVMPKSIDPAGWGDEDIATVDACLTLARSELTIDEARISAAGHSAGGAFAYLLTYLVDTKFNAVFTLSAPYYYVGSIIDPNYKAPIRMYYGTTDPNYTGGSYAALKGQWQRLGVAWEDDVQAGYGHNSWPQSSMNNGFLFLVGKRYPIPNQPPQITSGPTATPNPTAVGQNVQFTCAATDTQPMTWSWNFGDGTAAQSGTSTPSHTFNAAGTFTITVTVTDALNAATSKTMSLVVQGAGGGGGGGGGSGEGGGGGGSPPADTDGDGIPDSIDPDADNDGFTNAEEIANGTNPFDATSLPAGAGTGGTPSALTVTNLRAVLNFASPGHDELQVSGTVQLPAGYNPAGAGVTVDVGGVTKTFVLDAKGKAKSGSDSFGLKLKMVKKVFPGGAATFQLRSVGGSWSGAWRDEGASRDPSAKLRLTLRVSLVLRARSFLGLSDDNYSTDSKGAKARIALAR
jgi:predicted esterase